VLAQVQKDCAQDSIEHWATGLRVLLSRADPRRSAWAWQTVLSGLQHCTSQSPSVQFKQLRFVLPCLIELGWRGRAFAEAVLQQLQADWATWLASPYHVVRQEAGRVLVLITQSFFTDLARFSTPQYSAPSFASASDANNAPNTPNTASHGPSRKKQKGDDGKDEGDDEKDDEKAAKPTPPALPAALAAFVARVHAQLLTNSLVQGSRPASASVSSSQDGRDGAKETEAALVSSREAEQAFLQTLAGWVTLGVLSGDMAYMGPVWATLADALLSAHSPEAAKDFSEALHSANHSAACALIPEACLAFAVGQLKQASLATSWHVRKAATRFLTLFVPRHCFLLGQGEQRVVYKMLARLLEDPQLEVRESAYLALISLFSSADFLKIAGNRKKTVKRFMKLADTRTAGLKGAELRAAADKRHAGTLGLAAIVSSHPYDLPDYLPEVLAFLAGKARDQHPVGPFVLTLFSNFKVSHEDEWGSFKEKFTEAQLDAVNEVGFSASYFA